ncbi:MAG: SMP-30/gluconolactonase/LRE family protein, partial [Rhodoferax sp.]
YRYTLNADGTVAAKTVWRVFTDAEGTPDGMTHDADGNVWIAFWGGACIRQFTPEAELLQTIPLPATQITSMAFGGDDYRTLFVTSARIGLDVTTLQKYPLSGACFAFTPGVAGVAAMPFGAKP